MRPNTELWLVEDAGIDEPVEPQTIPEIKQRLARERHDDEIGLRSLLEHPEALRRSFARRGSQRLGTAA